MTIQIQNAELEAILQQRLDSVGDIEEFLLQALRKNRADTSKDTGTGADLIAAMRRCPFPDVDLEPERYRLPVREVELWLYSRICGQNLRQG